MFSSSKKSTSTIGIVFDIGISSVGAGLVRFQKGKSPNVLYSIRDIIPSHNTAHPTQLFKAMLDTLKSVGHEVSRHGLSHTKLVNGMDTKVSQVFYIYSSPWSMSESKMISVTKNKAFKVTEAYIQNLVDKDERLFETQAFKKNLIVVEKQITQVKLNGYETTNPGGKKTKRIDIAYLVSLLPKEVVSRVEEVDFRHNHPKLKKSFSLTLAAFSVIRDLHKNDSDFMFLDITSRLTDITIVKGGVIAECLSFPLGKDTVVDKIAKTLSMPYDIARSTLRAFVEGHIDRTLANRIKPVIERAQSEWLGNFHDSLSGFASKHSVPKKVFIIVSDDFTHFFGQAIKEAKTNHFNVDGQVFHVELLNYHHLKEKVTFFPSAPTDPFIALESIFVNKFLNP